MTALEVRIHGRGGQGVVTAAELLSVAAFVSGRHAQAFPSFGSERMGAPVVAFCRIDDRPIRTREPVVLPGAVVVQDPTLLHQVDLFNGMTDDTYLLVNTSRSLEELGIDAFVERFREERVAAFGATEIAIARLGRALPNAALLGGLAALTSVVRMEDLGTAFSRRFSEDVARGNLLAASDGFSRVARRAAIRAGGAKSGAAGGA